MIYRATYTKLELGWLIFYFAVYNHFSVVHIYRYVRVRYACARTSSIAFFVAWKVHSFFYLHGLLERQYACLRLDFCRTTFLLHNFICIRTTGMPKVGINRTFQIIMHLTLPHILQAEVRSLLNFMFKNTLKIHYNNINILISTIIWTRRVNTNKLILIRVHRCKLK